MASADLREELNCSICLALYTDPVILRCGHNFCRGCIDRVLDSQEVTGGYSCPDCREEFQQRPVLCRNITLRNVAERFLTSHPDQEDTGVFCTYCVDSPVPAIKSCLHCESSLCGKHLTAHSKSPEHVLSDPTATPGSRKCSVHKRVLEFYCSQENVSTCLYCIAVGEHKGHNVESLEEASENKKKKLRNDREKLILEKEEAEKEVQRLEERRREAQEKAAGVTERVTALFRDIQRLLQKQEKSVLSDVSRWEEQVSQSVSGLIKQLEIKKDELCTKIRHMEELCSTTDPLTVLQDPHRGDICDTKGGGGGDMKNQHGGDLDEGRLSDMLHKLSDMIQSLQISIIQPSDVLLDEKTAANDVGISEDLKTASYTGGNLNRPATPERFVNYQVLSSWRISSGQHCWEVDTSGSTSWRVGMCYPSMSRSTCIGQNTTSWCLRRSSDEYSKMYNNHRVPFSHMFSSHKFRIYLDYESGQLSFYELCDPIRHLHTYTATFTEPLHAAISVFQGSVKITT
ncbi:E3 ubiquitin/ISG15 ligase TRIM25-like [Hyperolius riggenbachi]|uniref:E3 ubiquitin/ISG15 ligase TRIM25-like n=1 Tax=Hyperolius riggenbachi TaxID=752182 RepID=UPI0035A27B8F